MQNQLSFLMPFKNDRLHLRELPPFVRFLIGALVIEVFTAVVVVVVVVVFSLWLSQNIQNIMWLRKIFRLRGACQTLALTRTPCLCGDAPPPHLVSDSILIDHHTHHPTLLPAAPQTAHSAPAKSSQKILLNGVRDPTPPRAATVDLA